MIVFEDAELMVPALPGFETINGLGGLGCGDDASCGCGCKLKSGMGDITDRSDFGLALCNWTLLRFTSMCDVSSTVGIIDNPSDCGKSLDPAACQAAAIAAAQVVAADKSSDPCRYSDLADASWWDYITCNLKDSGPSAQGNTIRNWLVFGGIGLGLFVIVKR